MSKKETFKLTAISAAMLAVFGADSALADEITELTKPDSFVSVGVGNWSNDRPQQGIYDGMREAGAYGILDASVIKRDDATGTWLNFNARNVGLDTHEVGLEWLRQGDIGAKIEYSRTPRTNPNKFITGLQGIGTTNELISGAGGSALPRREVTLGTRRDLTQLSFFKNLSNGLDFSATLKNEDKTGTRHWGMGSNPFFMVEPIDSNTLQLETVLRYTTERLQLEGGYYGSWYNNANSLVFGRINGAATPGTTSSPNPTPLTLPLDNQAHQFFLHSGYAITPTTRATLKLEYTRATQDETLPTFNLPAPNDRFVGAPSNLNGRLDMTLVQLGLTSRPMEKLSLMANVLYRDQDDKTPLAGFVGDNTTGAITVHNTPHSFTTTTGRFEAIYQLPEDFNLIGGVDLSRQDRTFPQFDAERFVPFRAKLDEDTYRVQLRRSLSETLNGAIAFLHSKRDGSEFTASNEAPENEINPIHIADRKRNKIRLSLDWTPMDKLGLQFNYENAHDEYGNSASRPYGLRDGKGMLFSVDANYAVNDKWQMTGWLSHDETKANQFGGRWSRSTEEHEADKNAHLKDTGDSIGIGLRGSVAKAWKVGADLQRTRNKSVYQEDVSLTGVFNPSTGFGTRYPTSGGVTAVPLPDIQNRLTKLALFTEYAVQKNADIRFDFIHERWRTDDWTWQFANGSPFTYGTTTDGTTVVTTPKQISNFIGARYTYKFQ